HRRRRRRRSRDRRRHGEQNPTNHNRVVLTSCSPDFQWEAYMNKAEVIASVAGDLNSAEQSLDTAIAQATTLIQSMIGARTALSLSPISGAGSQARAMEAIAAMATARE